MKYCVSPCPIIPVEVKGIGTVCGLVDSGAGTCVIRLDVIQNRISYTVPEKLLVLTVANGAQMVVLGHVSLDITFMGRIVRLNNVWVVKECNFPFILGVNWIIAAGIMIRSNGRQLVVQCEKSLVKSAKKKLKKAGEAMKKGSKKVKENKVKKAAKKVKKGLKKVGEKVENLAKKTKERTKKAGKALKKGWEKNKGTV